MRIVFYRKIENNSNNRNNIVFVTYHVGTRRVALLDLAFPFHTLGFATFIAKRGKNAARRDSLASLAYP